MRVKEEVVCKRLFHCLIVSSGFVSDVSVFDGSEIERIRTGVSDLEDIASVFRGRNAERLVDGEIFYRPIPSGCRVDIFVISNWS